MVVGSSTTLYDSWLRNEVVESMLSLVRRRHSRAASFPHESAYGFMVVNEEGVITTANVMAIGIAQLFNKRRLRPSSVIGKKLNEVFGPNYEDTLIGQCVTNKRSVYGRYLIGSQLYLVVIDRIEDADNVHYEAFYFPIHDDYDHRSKEKSLFQNIAYKVAQEKGYVDIDWIKSISNAHAKLLIECLNRQEPAIRPGWYCPFRSKCGFNDVYGWMRLDRRSYYRTRVHMDCEIYLIALKDKEVPKRVSRKKVLCTALDLSLRGTKLQSDVRFPVGSTLRLVFESFSCCGIVRWNKKQGDQWLFGVQFQDLMTQQRNRIIKAITARRIKLVRSKFNP